MIFSIDLFIIITAVITAILFIYTFYDNIFFNNKTQTSNKFKFHTLASAGGALVPYGNPVPNNNDHYPNNDVFDEVTTVVELTDAELNELLQIVFAEIGNSNLISVQLLQSLGLYTDTVVSVLESLGYIIF